MEPEVAIATPTAEVPPTSIDVSTYTPWFPGFRVQNTIYSGARTVGFQVGVTPPQALRAVTVQQGKDYFVEPKAFAAWVDEQIYAIVRRVYQEDVAALARRRTEYERVAGKPAPAVAGRVTYGQWCTKVWPLQPEDVAPAPLPAASEWIFFESDPLPTTESPRADGEKSPDAAIRFFVEAEYERRLALDPAIAPLFEHAGQDMLLWFMKKHTRRAQ